MALIASLPTCTSEVCENASDGAAALWPILLLLSTFGAFIGLLDCSRAGAKMRKLCLLDGQLCFIIGDTEFIRESKNRIYIRIGFEIVRRTDENFSEYVGPRH